MGQEEQAQGASGSRKQADKAWKAEVAGEWGRGDAAVGRVEVSQTSGSWGLQLSDLECFGDCSGMSRARFSVWQAKTERFGCTKVRSDRSSPFCATGSSIDSHLCRFSQQRSQAHGIALVSSVPKHHLMQATTTRIWCGRERGARTQRRVKGEGRFRLFFFSPHPSLNGLLFNLAFYDASRSWLAL